MNLVKIYQSLEPVEVDVILKSVNLWRYGIGEPEIHRGMVPFLDYWETLTIIERVQRLDRFRLRRPELGDNLARLQKKLRWLGFRLLLARALIQGAIAGWLTYWTISAIQGIISRI